MKKMIRGISLFLMLFLLTAQSVSAARLLVPVGQVIGLELRDDRVSIAGFDEALGAAAREAGLQEGDQITMIDHTPIRCAQDVQKALTASDGDVDIHILRGSTEKELELEPVITQNGPKLGVYLRQGITGVGTVTFYDPDSGLFGALGHGVNDKSGQLVAMSEGLAYPAVVDSIKKGRSGDPGQLMGSVTQPEPFAQLFRNAQQGVFGNAEAAFAGEALPVAAVSEITTGPATIRSTILGSTVREYSVEILKIYPGSGSDGRNLLLKVTDPALLETTGGIVQGMSGSPIIQDGKLVGAVTHVLVNSPDTGYGIFIENMLDAAA